MRAADEDVKKLRIKFFAAEKERKDAEAEARPLSTTEQEYLDIQRKWQRYYDTMFPRDKSKDFLDAETKEVYSQQMHAWMKRMERMQDAVRQSVRLGTYKGLSEAKTTTGREQKLKALNIPDNIVASIEAAAVAGLDSSAANARIYAGAIGKAATEYGVEGVKTQILYLLINMRQWQGEEAREHKKILKKWAISRS